MYVIVDTRCVLPPALPVTTPTSEATRSIQNGQQRAQNIASANSTLSNLHAALLHYAKSPLLAIAAETKFLSIVPSSIKLIFDTTTDGSKKKKITSLATSEHLSLAEAADTAANTTADTTANTTAAPRRRPDLLSKCIDGARKWSKAVSKQNLQSSVVIFTVGYVPTLTKQIEDVLRKCEMAVLDIHFVVIDDDCKLVHDISTLEFEMSQRAFATKISVHSVFSDTQEILTRLSCSLSSLMPTQQIELNLDLGASSMSSSSKIRLVGSKPLVLSSSNKKRGGDTNTNVLQLSNARRVLLGSVAPDYLDSENTYHVRPAQDQETLEERQSSSNSFLLLLRALASGSLQDDSGVGMMLTETGGGGGSGSGSGSGGGSSSGDSDYDWLLIQSSSSMAGVVCGRMWRIRKWTEVAPRQTEVVIGSSVSSSTPSDQKLIHTLTNLPLTTFDPLGRLCRS